MNEYVEECVSGVRAFQVVFNVLRLVLVVCRGIAILLVGYFDKRRKIILNMWIVRAVYLICDMTLMKIR